MDTELSVLPMEYLREACARESKLYYENRAHNPLYCYELFRRAIVLRNEEAWRQIYSQYQPQVACWVRAHRAYPHCNEQVEYFVNAAFAKFWQAITPEKFARFDALDGLLRYLQMCTASVILDHRRTCQKRILLPTLEDAVAQHNPESLPAATPVEQQLDAQALWEEVSELLKNETERMIAQCVFQLQMSPRDIIAQYPDHFDDPKQLYRIIENMRKRFRRNAVLCQWLTGEDVDDSPLHRSVCYFREHPRK